MDRGEGQQWAQAPGNLYSTPKKVTFDPRKGGTIDITLDQGHPADRAAEGHQVHQARAHPERAAHEVLGPADAPRRQRAPAGRLGHASRRALSALHLSRPLPVHLRRLPRGAAGSRRSSPTSPPASGSRATTASSSSTRTSSTRTGPAPGFPRALVIEIQHPDAVLRRQLRGELRQQRPVRRRDREGAAALHREEIPRHRRGLGALHVRRLDRRLGSDGRAGLLSRRVQRRLYRLPGSDRLPRLHRRRSLQGQERLLPRRHVEEDAAARRCATTSGTSARRSRR